MADGVSKVLERMLDRLFAAIANGPSLNCRPHNSRQRIDLTQLSRLADRDAGAALLELLGETGQMRVLARHPAPPPPRPLKQGQEEPPETAAARRAYNDQQSLLT